MVSASSSGGRRIPDCLTGAAASIRISPGPTLVAGSVPSGPTPTACEPPASYPSASWLAPVTELQVSDDQTARAVGSACQDVAVERKGPFWDAVEGRAPLPAAAATLGWELVSISTEEGAIEVAFRASEAFLNPAGFIQGGFLAAMLDDTLGPALVAGLEPGDFAPTTDLHVQFLRPARPGRLLGRGRVVRRGRDVGFLAGELLDEEGVIVAVATATVQIRTQML